MKRELFLIVIILTIFSSGLFGEDYEVLYKNNYSNCTLQLVKSEDMYTLLMFEIRNYKIFNEWVISSYNEKLIKNFLFYLVENSPKKYPNEYDLTIIPKYDKEHEELVLLDEKTKINKDNTLTKRYSYKLELE
jgi:hypothetical protein